MSFQAIYRLPYNEKNLQEYKQYVEPPYSYIRRRPTIVVVDLYKKNIDSLFKTAGKDQGYSVDWARQNAQYNGIKVDDAKNSIFVITGEKDITNLDKFIKQVKKFVEKKPTLWDKIASLFTSDKADEFEFNPDKSAYLNAVAHVLKNLQDEHGKFEDYLSDAKVVGVDTTQQLFMKMLQER